MRSPPYKHRTIGRHPEETPWEGYLEGLESDQSPVQNTRKSNKKKEKNDATDNVEMATMINKYFCDIGTNLASSIPYSLL